MHQQADVVVVGLGISGLSAAMKLSQEGYSVIGFQQFASSGAVGTSSTGLTRMFRVTQNNPQLQECAKYDFKEWKKIEKEAWTNIIYMTGGLNVGPKDNPSMKMMLESQLEEGDQVLNSQEIMKRWPAFKLDSNYIGIYSRDMGFIDVKAALSSIKNLALKHGAKLSYKSNVKQIDQKNKTISVEKDGKVINVSYKVGLIMCCGPYSPEFKEDPTVQRIETEYFKIKDASGMPSVCLFYDQNPLYWLPNDPDNTNIKIGLHCARSLFALQKKIKKVIPSKVDELLESYACYYTLRKPDVGLHIYRQGDIVWAYGYSGHGLKHGPSIGKMVASKVDELKMKPKL